MRRTVLAAILLGLSPLAAPAKEPAGFSDQAVGKAITKAVDYLWSLQNKDNGNWMEVRTEGVPFASPGISALAVYALLEADTNPQDERMGKALEWLAKQKTSQTYVLSLRANAFLAVQRSGQKYHKNLEKDVRALLSGLLPGGGFTYSVPYTPPPTLPPKAAGLFPPIPIPEGDNSNAQYGVLGVWAGARAGMEIPKGFWANVERHWIGCQNADGGWSYMRGHRTDSYPAMTVAGLATAFICMDNLSMEKYMECGAPPEVRSIKAGMDWMEKNFADSIRIKELDERTGAEGSAQGATMYYFFGVERVGLASGYKYFGEQDWYRIIASRLLELQQENGSFRGTSWDGGTTGATAYALLLLVRGRHAVLFNKLQYDGDWNNRPRNLALLTAWLSKTFENTVNWQIINLKVPVAEWHDAPILFVSGAGAPKFSDEDIARLRAYVLQGGTIFSCTECSGANFKTGIRQAYAKMFPKYEMVPCGPEDRIYSLHYQLQGKPAFSVVSNGVRPLVIHTDEDISVQWLMQREATQRKSYEAAANVFLAVTDKTSLRHRGVRGWPDEVKLDRAQTIRLARLSFNGNCDPEPLAYERFSRMMAADCGIRVEVAGPMEPADLPASGARLAVMGGTGAFTLPAPQKEALKKWVLAGGTLLLEAAGGSKEFADSAEKLAAELFGEQVGMLASQCDLYQLKGMEIGQAKFRRLTNERLRVPTHPLLRAIPVKDRPAVLVSREDIVSGLLGTTACTIDGYDAASAFALMRNIVIYADGGLKPPTTTSAPASSSAPAASSPSQRKDH